MSAGTARLIDLHAGAARIGVSFWTFREYVLAGLIPAVDLPCPLNPKRRLRRRLVDVRDVDAFVDRCKADGGAR